MSLYHQAGYRGQPGIVWSEELRRTHQGNERRYAQVMPLATPPVFELAPQSVHLPAKNRRALLAHEVGHVLDPRGSEDEADAAAFQSLGVQIGYDHRWPGKGLQVQQNPITDAEAAAIRSRIFAKEGATYAGRSPVNSGHADWLRKTFPEPWPDSVARTWKAHRTVGLLEKAGAVTAENLPGGYQRVRLTALGAEAARSRFGARRNPPSRTPDRRVQAARRAYGASGTQASQDAFLAAMFQAGRLGELSESPDPYMRFVARNLAGDLHMNRTAGGGYTPTKGVIYNRLIHEHDDRIKEIGESLFGSQFHAERVQTPEPTWWFTHRDNRDRSLWHSRIYQLIGAFEFAGYVTSSSMPNSVSLNDPQGEKDLAASIHARYVPFLRAMGGGGERLSAEQNPPTQADKILAAAVRPCMTAAEAKKAATSIKRSLALVERRSAVRGSHRRGILQLLKWAQAAKKPSDRIRWTRQAQDMLKPLLVRGPGSRVLRSETDPRLGRLMAANPDPDIRRLERAASQGDPQARRRLAVARIRAGEPRWDDQAWAMSDERLARLARRVVKGMESSVRRRAIHSLNAFESSAMEAALARGVLDPAWLERYEDGTRCADMVYDMFRQRDHSWEHSDFDCWLPRVASNPPRDWQFGWHCPAPPEHWPDLDFGLVDYITDRGEDVDCKDFLREVGPGEVEANWYGGGSSWDHSGYDPCKDYHISWYRSHYPDGTPIYFHTASGIEHVWEPKGYTGP